MRKRINFFIILSVLSANIIYSLSLFAKEDAKEENEGFLPIPVVLYTPETGIAGGLAFMYFHNPDANNEKIKPNVIKSSVLYTEKNQIKAGVRFERYFNGNAMKLELGLDYEKMPLFFYGIGANTPSYNEELYSMLKYGGKGRFIAKTCPNFYYGGIFEYYQFDMLEKKKAGIFDCENILGSQGTIASGIGMIANWDSRNKLFFPTDGAYWESKMMLYSRAYGSEYDFLLLDMDYRRYIGLGGRNVLALQGILKSRFGDVPFQRKSHIGGTDMMRGYYQGRYIDDQYIACQTELRYHIWWRFAGTVFGSIGQLAPRINKFSTHNLKLAGGFGFRLLVDTDELLFLRADIAFTEFGPQLYLEALEAF